MSTKYCLTAASSSESGDSLGFVCVKGQERKRGNKVGPIRTGLSLANHHPFFALTICSKMVEHFPQELINHILDFLQDDTTSLLEAATVCRRWSTPIRYLLYRSRLCVVPVGT